MIREEIQGMFNAQIVIEFEKYLGLSMVGGKNKMSTFKDLWECIAKKITGWKEKYISKAGGEVTYFVAQVIDSNVFNELVPATESSLS